MPIDEFSEKNSHPFVNSDLVVNVTTDTEELSTLILVATEASEP